MLGSKNVFALSPPPPRSPATHSGLVPVSPPDMLKMTPWVRTQPNRKAPSTRNSEAEELGATLVTMSGGEVENSVPPYRGDVLVNVTGVEKIGKGPMTAYVFRYPGH